MKKLETVPYTTVEFGWGIGVKVNDSKKWTNVVLRNGSNEPTVIDVSRLDVILNEEGMFFNQG